MKLLIKIIILLSSQQPSEKNNKKINKPVVANPGERDALCVAFSAATPLVPRTSEAYAGFLFFISYFKQNFCYHDFFYYFETPRASEADEDFEILFFIIYFKQSFCYHDFFYHFETPHTSEAYEFY